MQNINKSMLKGINYNNIVNLFLFNSNPLTKSEIAQKLSTSITSVSRFISELEKNNIIIKIENKKF